jgi:hypothetical protein
MEGLSGRRRWKWFIPKFKLFCILYFCICACKENYSQPPLLPVEISTGVVLVCWKEERQDSKTPNLVIPMAGEKVPERRSSLRPFEEELPERRSGAFRHKNTPEKYHKYRNYTLIITPKNTNVWT